MIRRTFLKALACLPLAKYLPIPATAAPLTILDGTGVESAVLDMSHPLNEGLVKWWVKGGSIVDGEWVPDREFRRVK